MKIIIILMAAFICQSCFAQKNIELGFETENVTVTTEAKEVSYQSRRKIRLSSGNLSIQLPCSQGSRSDYGTWLGLSFVSQDGCVKTYATTPLGDYTVEIDTCKLEVSISSRAANFDYKERYY